MLSLFDSITLGIVQGLTEFLPISSSGHLIIARDVLGMQVSGGLAFDAILQLVTGFAVVLYFRKDILDLIANLFKKNRDIEKTKLTIAIIVGTIPAIIFGLLLQDYMDSVFRNVSLVALTLLIGSLIMYVADVVLKKYQDKGEGNKPLTLIKGLCVGLFQCLALVPGMSRSGMTISGGYFLGLSKEMAIRFSFLLSIPIIVGSGLIKVHDVVKDPSIINGQVSTLLVGAAFSFIFGWIAIDFLLKFLKTNSFKGFVIYRIVLAVMLLLFVAF